jgi:hypothetical protein
MVTPKTGKPRGRPKGSIKELTADKHRYVVPFADALIRLGSEKTQAVYQATILWFGRLDTIEQPTTERPFRAHRRAPLRRNKIGKVRAVFFGRSLTPPLQGRISGVEKKVTRPPRSEAERRWREHMALAFTTALSGKCDPRCEAFITQSSSVVGESMFAETFLLPLWREMCQTRQNP